MTWLHVPNSHSFQAQAAGCSEPHTCSAGERSVMSNGTAMPSKSSKPESAMDTSTTLPSGMMPSASTGDRGLDLWMLSLRDFRASPSALQARDLPRTIRATGGQRSSASFAKYDPDSRFWRMYPALFQNHTSSEFSGIFPKQGSIRNGVAYRRKPLVRTTKGNGSGWWPTPRSEMWHGGDILAQIKQTPSSFRRSPKGVEMTFPTPRASDSKGSGPRGSKSQIHMEARSYLCATVATEAGGQLNPNWVEWLMGWPIGWTDLKPLETDKFRQWCEKHGIDYQELT